MLSLWNSKVDGHDLGLTLPDYAIELFLFTIPGKLLKAFKPKCPIYPKMISQLR